MDDYSETYSVLSAAAGKEKEISLLTKRFSSLSAPSAPCCSLYTGYLTLFLEELLNLCGECLCHGLSDERMAHCVELTSEKLDTNKETYYYCHRQNVASGCRNRRYQVFKVASNGLGATIHLDDVFTHLMNLAPYFRSLRNC